MTEAGPNVRKHHVILTFDPTWNIEPAPDYINTDYMIFLDPNMENTPGRSRGPPAAPSTLVVSVKVTVDLNVVFEIASYLRDKIPQS